MEYFDWQRRYGVLPRSAASGWKDYAGEIRRDKNGNSCRGGTGLHVDGEEYIVAEQFKDGVFSGAYFWTEAQYTDGARFEAGFFEDGKKRGHRLTTAIVGAQNKKYYPIKYSYVEPDGSIRRQEVTIYTNGEYTISQYFPDGDYYKTVSFKSGCLMLEKRKKLDVPTRPIATVKCGWKYEMEYRGSYIPRFRSPIETLVSSPAHRDDGCTGLLYMSQLGSKFGIFKYGKGRYFGEVESSAQTGNCKPGGFGCYRDSKSKTYKIGNFGFLDMAMECSDSEVSLGMYEVSLKRRTFLEIHESDVTIRWYDPELGFGKIGKDNVYKINSTTFDVEVFAPKAQKGNLAIFQLPEFELKERIDFEKCAKENPNGVDTGLRGKDLVSPRLLERLKGDGFICKVTDEGKIHIVGFAPKTPTDTVDIPDYVHRIESGAFKNNSSIKNVYTKAKEIGADAFRDCKNIETLLLFDGIETLEPNIFESEKLTELEIPATVKLVRNYSFFHCKNLKKVRFSDKSKCDVEHMAFPIDCEIIDEAAPKAPEKKEEEHKERKSLLSMLLSPLSAMRSLLKSTSSITFIGAALMAVYVVLAMTGAIQYLSWESRPISPSDNIFFGYEWELGALGVMLFGKISGSGIWGVFIFIAALLVLLIGGLIDIILYVLMFLVLVALPMIVQVLLQLLLIFGFPVIIPIGAFVLIFTARRKLPPILTFLISTPCAVIYFMNLASYL